VEQAVMPGPDDPRCFTPDRNRDIAILSIGLSLDDGEIYLDSWFQRVLKPWRKSCAGW
jgi:hypothetical protein